MPETPDEITLAQHDFYRIARLPRVVAAIDGTHIRIKSPGGNDAEMFRNRKGYFSLNVQTVCSSDLKILYLVVRWPGSAHDITMLNSCRLRQRFETGEFPNCALLGDSGYNLRPYLMTPLLNSNTRAEQLYNEAHIRTRNTVERQIGVWKMRFPILAYGCRLKLETLLEFTGATAIIHNICIDNNEPEPPQPEERDIFQMMQQNDVPNIPLQNEADNNALQVRQNLINNYFANIDL